VCDALELACPVTVGRLRFGSGEPRWHRMPRFTDASGPAPRRQSSRIVITASPIQYPLWIAAWERFLQM